MFNLKLLLSVVAATGTIAGGGIAWAMRGLKGSEMPNPSTSKGKSTLVDGEFTSPRKNKISQSDSRDSSLGCFIYGIDKVYRDSSTNETSFDELKSTYTSKEAFFAGAGIKENEKSDPDLSTLCASSFSNYFYVGNEQGTGDRTIGGKYSGS